MPTQTISLKVPDQLYKKLAEAADASKRTLDEVILQSIRVGLPPNIDNFPDELRANLHALDQESDATLWRIARSELAEEKTVIYEELLARNQDNQLSATERTQLAELRAAADTIMFRSSYAYALLKWRGHRIPGAAEMQMP